MSLAGRILFFVVAVLYTGLATGFVVVMRRSLPATSDPTLSDAARHYRFALHCRVLPQLAICLVCWTVAISWPISDATLIFLASLMFLCMLLPAIAAVVWRKEFRTLQEAGLVKGIWFTN
jgi:hypothetical protein